MKVNLIPCPDCGADAEVKRGCYPGMSQVYSYVHCTSPSCELAGHTLHFTAATPAESDLRAAQSWNERYADTLPLERACWLDMPVPATAGNARARKHIGSGLHA